MVNLKVQMAVAASGGKTLLVRDCRALVTTSLQFRNVGARAMVLSEATSLSLE